MMRVVSVLLCLLFVVSGCSLAPQKRPDQLAFPALEFDFPTVERYQLDNGLQLAVLPDHELPLVEISVLVSGGRLYDPADKAGLSTLLAMTLESGGAGDKTPRQFEETLERLAADFAVEGDTYVTRLRLSVRQEDLQQGLKLLADVLLRPRFDGDRFELARRQMVEGIRRQDDHPSSIAGRILAGSVYGDHPFGRSATRASVEKISRADLVAYHHRFFHPDQVWMAVSGDVETAQLLALLEDVLAPWDSVSSAGYPLPATPQGADTQILLIDKDLPQTTILMGHPGIDKDNPDLFALKVANYILGGGGFNARLMREIRSNRGLAYSVYSHFQVGRRLPELFIVSSETKTESTAEVVNIIRQQIDRLRSERVSEAELTLAKQSLINSFVFAFDKPHAVASRQMRLEFYNYPPDYLESYRDHVAAVDAEDVLRAAQRYLRPDLLQIVLVGRADEIGLQFVDSTVPVGRVEPPTP